jgi:hypothetical protein
VFSKSANVFSDFPFLTLGNFVEEALLDGLSALAPEHGSSSSCGMKSLQSFCPFS